MEFPFTTWKGARNELSGTKFLFPGIGNSRELSTIPGKFPGMAKMTQTLGIPSFKQEKML